MSSPTPRLIVGVDGDGHADGAVHAAFALSQRLHGEVELLHVAEVPHPLWQSLGEGDLAAARARTVDRLAGVLTDIPVSREEIDRRLVVRPGSPGRELLAAAEGAAWIFVGGHHSEGPLDFGNNLRGVLAGATCPVWIQPGPFHGIKRVLAACDLSDQARHVMATARDVAAAFRTGVEVNYVFARPDLGYVLGYPVPFPEAVVTHAREAAESGLASSSRAIDWAGVEVTTRFREGDPASELITAPARGEVLVLGTHGHTALLGAILGGVARRVLSEAREPLVVVRET